MGKNIVNILKSKEVGSIGIGAMIVFIAMVLVAGISASVLIQTSTRLEMQTLQTGTETIAEVATGVLVEGIEGYNQSGLGLLTLMAIELMARAGSFDVDLSQAVIELSNSSAKVILKYSGNLLNVTEVDGDIFNAAGFTGADVTHFSIVVLQDADGSCTEDTPIINFGDHVTLAVNTSAIFGGGLLPRIDVFGQVIPEEGAPGIIGFKTPSSYTGTVMELQ
jgi:flagellin FlaB